MSESKGLSDWIEIFKGGKQFDSQGREHDGNEIIEKAVSTFNTSEHEPPVIIGYPNDNAPAYGWVSNLKTSIQNGMKILYAKVSQTLPEFEDLVRNKLFKQRIVGFYPDGRLRHIRFVGAAPPVLKGLEGVKFNDAFGIECFNFSSSLDPGQELQRLIAIALQCPPKKDHYGRPIEKFNYSKALEFVARENPELVQEYIQTFNNQKGGKL